MLRLLHCNCSLVCRKFASISLKEAKPNAVSRKKLKDAAGSVKLPRDEHQKLANKYDMPRHPGTAFSIFIAEALPGSSAGLMEHSRKWQELDEAQKKEYSRLHHERLENYRQKLQEWREHMIASGREKTVAILEFGKSWVPNSYRPVTRQDKTTKQLASDNEMPKRPSPAFNRFRQHISSTSPTIVKVQECRRLWEDLSADKKTEYKEQFHAEYVVYRQKMQEWKTKMIASGRVDVVKKLECVYNRTPLPAEYGKPNYPTLPIDRFKTEILGEIAEGEIFEDKFSLWNSLSSEEREKYTEPFKVELFEYKFELAKWKRNMIANGYEEIMNYQLRNKFQRRKPRNIES